MSNGAPTASADLRRAASTSGGWMTVTAGTPALKMPAFSVAMWASVGPSWAMWSMLMLVTAATSGVSTLVLSSRPPRPVSTTMISVC